MLARRQRRPVVEFVACDTITQHVVTRRRYRAIVFGDYFHGHGVKPRGLSEIVTAIRTNGLRGMVEQVAPRHADIGTRVYHDAFRVIHALIA